MKRLFDILLSILALTILWLPLLAVGILVKLTSAGPVLYWSDRIGKNAQSISNINQYGITDERLWIKGARVNLRESIELNKDEVVEEIHSWNGKIDLNGRKLTVGAGGINIYENAGIPTVWGEGSITSSSTSLNFYFKNKEQLETGYVVAAKITDAPGHKVGLTLNGSMREGKNNYIDLAGDESNTFTGDVYIANLARLVMYKNNDATAVLGDIYARDGGEVIIAGNEQINNSSKVVLRGCKSEAILSFSSVYNDSVTEKFNKLSIDGAGVINFHRTVNIPDGSRNFLYLDDLEIGIDSSLIIRRWELGRDFLLVRKDSKNLQDALSRIKFEGYEPNAGGLERYDFNKDYWQIIPQFPEPATYGAGLVLITLGLVRYRQRCRRVVNTATH